MKFFGSAIVTGTVLSAAVFASWIPATAYGNITITTAFGQGADAEIGRDKFSSSVANTNYGSTNSTTVKFILNSNGVNSDEIWSKKGYVRFDLSGLAQNEVITGASLSLSFLAVNQTSLARVVNIFGLIDSSTGEDWGETTITWNNAPGNDKNSRGGVYTTPGTAGVTTAAVYLGSYDMTTGNGTKTLSGQALVDFLKADTNGLVTFIFTVSGYDGTQVNQQYATKDGTLGAAPTLSLTTETIPEPASLAGLGVVSLGLILHRRNK